MFAEKKGISISSIPKLIYIDHIDGNTQNNSADNLRAVTPRMNAQNTYKQRNGHLCGVTAIKNNKSYMARIFINGSSIYLGLFSTPEQANRIYLTTYIDRVKEIDIQNILKKNPEITRDFLEWILT